MAFLAIHKANYDIDTVAPALSSSMPLIKNLLAKPPAVVPMSVAYSWPNNCNGAVMLYQYMTERSEGNPELVKRYREAVIASKCEWLLA